MNDKTQEIQDFLSKGYYSSMDSVDIEYLLAELDKAKAEVRQQIQMRYNATEAHTNNLSKTNGYAVQWTICLKTVRNGGNIAWNSKLKEHH